MHLKGQRLERYREDNDKERKKEGVEIRKGGLISWSEYEPGRRKVCV
jgi:hypothetical protein